MACQGFREASQTLAYSSLLVMVWDNWGALKSLESYKALKAILALCHCINVDASPPAAQQHVWGICT